LWQRAIILEVEIEQSVDAFERAPMAQKKAARRTCRETDAQFHRRLRGFVDCRLK
jgi:hypothetical protein